MHAVLINLHDVTIIWHVQIKILTILTRDLYHEHLFRNIENIIWKIWGVTMSVWFSNFRIRTEFFLCYGVKKNEFFTNLDFIILKLKKYGGFESEHP